MNICRSASTCIIEALRRVWANHPNTGGVKAYPHSARAVNRNLAVLNWIRSQGWYGDVTVGEVQFGFEITSSAGGMDFVSNSYSVSFS